MRILIGILALAATAGCGRLQATSEVKGADASCIARADGIEDKLSCLPRVKWTKVDSGAPIGYVRYEIQFDQPEDHFGDTSKRFEQRLVLLHKSEAEPVLLHTSGYSIFGVSLSNVAATFEMNQIQVEHRFFSNSIPADPDWTKLDIQQSAADFHAIVEDFKQIYAGKWLNTGASKGGMTSVYHRRFYPSDLDGTLALVAPLSFSKEDERYVTFVDNAGGDAYAECRAKLVAVQRAILARRAEILEGYEDAGYDQLGGLDVAFEHAVIELPFVYFQYQNVTPRCDLVPEPDAPANDLNVFLEYVVGISSYGDEGMAGFVPYFFQAANQLGAPGANLDVIGDLLRHRETYNVDRYIPAGLPLDYSNEAMLDVKDWVVNQSERIMFIYGELDPWSAGAFTPRAEPAGDSHLFTVTRGNHGADAFKLSADDKAAALAKLGSWIGKGIDETEAFRGPSLEALEAEFRAKHRL